MGVRFGWICCWNWWDVITGRRRVDVHSEELQLLLLPHIFQSHQVRPAHTKTHQRTVWQLKKKQFFWMAHKKKKNPDDTEALFFLRKSSAATCRSGLSVTRKLHSVAQPMVMDEQETCRRWRAAQPGVLISPALLCLAAAPSEQETAAVWALETAARQQLVSFPGARRRETIEPRRRRGSGVCLCSSDTWRRVWIESHTRGATFWIMLPRLVALEPRASFDTVILPRGCVATVAVTRGACCVKNGFAVSGLHSHSLCHRG